MIRMIEWKPIDTAPTGDDAPLYLLGFDACGAEFFNDPEAGICIISHNPDFEEYDEPEWDVHEVDGSSVASETNVTHWAYFPSPPDWNGRAVNRQRKQDG